MFFEASVLLAFTSREQDIDVKLPGIVQLAVWLTFFNTWVLFEETVIDRNGWWEYMPYYRVGQLCSWDIGAMALLGFVVWRFTRRASARLGSS